MERWHMSSLSFPQPCAMRMKNGDSHFKGKQNKIKIIRNRNVVSKTKNIIKAKTKPRQKKLILTNAEISVYPSK